MQNRLGLNTRGSIGTMKGTSISSLANSTVSPLSPSIPHPHFKGTSPYHRTLGLNLKLSTPNVMPQGPPKHLQASSFISKFICELFSVLCFLHQTLDALQFIVLLELIAVYLPASCPFVRLRYTEEPEASPHLHNSPAPFRIFELLQHQSQLCSAHKLSAGRHDPSILLALQLRPQSEILHPQVSRSLLLPFSPKEPPNRSPVRALSSSSRYLDDSKPPTPVHEQLSEGSHARTDPSVEVPYVEATLPSSKPVQGRAGLHFKRTLASFSLEGKVGVVTGGARGLGLVMAQALVISGADVGIVDLNSEFAL